MFCALNGRTRRPSWRNILQSAVTSRLFPTEEAVPWTMRAGASIDRALVGERRADARDRLLDERLRGRSRAFRKRNNHAREAFREAGVAEARRRPRPQRPRNMQRSELARDRLF